jgi:hypothetical protein
MIVFLDEADQKDHPDEGVDVGFGTEDHECRQCPQPPRRRAVRMVRVMALMKFRAPDRYEDGNNEQRPRLGEDS